MDIYIHLVKRQINTNHPHGIAALHDAEIGGAGADNLGLHVRERNANAVFAVFGHGHGHDGGDATVHHRGAEASDDPQSQAAVFEDEEVARVLHQREAGAHRYLLRIETTNRDIYARLHPSDHDWDERLRSIERLRECGYQVGTGVLIGLPGQTVDDLAADLALPTLARTFGAGLATVQWIVVGYVLQGTRELVLDVLRME